MSPKNFRLNLALRLLRGWEYFLVIHETDGNNHGGAVIMEGEVTDHLSAIAESGMEHKEECRAIILDAARQYLRKYVIDRNTFAKEIYED